MKMKSFFLFAAMAAAPAANAATTACIDPTTTDHGYAVEISADRAKATVKKITMAGPTDIATLTCSHLNIDPLTAAPGSDVLVCREADVADYGFSVVVKTVDCTGKTNARLEEQSIAGPRGLAELTCADKPEPTNPAQEPK